MKSVDRRESDADELMEKARKDLKTSMFKRKPNYEEAVAKMEHAAKMYAIAKNLSKASDAWRAAADAHMQLHEEILAAKCLENISKLTKELGSESNHLTQKNNMSNEYFNNNNNNNNNNTDSDGKTNSDKGKNSKVCHNNNNTSENNNNNVDKCVASLQNKKNMEIYAESGSGSGDKFRTNNGNDDMINDPNIRAVLILKESADLYRKGGDLAQQGDVLMRALTMLVTMIKKLWQEEHQQQYQHVSQLTGQSGHDLTQKASSVTPLKKLAQLEMLYKSFFALTVSALENEKEVNGVSPYKLLEVYRSGVQLALYKNEYENAIQLTKRMLGFDVNERNTSGAKSRSVYHKEKDLLNAVNQPSNAAKAVLEIVILSLTLYRNGTQAREKLVELSGVNGFGGSHEEQTADALIAAYEENNADELQKAINSSFCLSFLDASVSRLAKKLTIPHDNESSLTAKAHDKNRVNTVQQTTTFTSSSPTANEEKSQSDKVEQTNADYISSEEDLR